MTIEVVVNGRRHELACPPSATLAEVLRDELGLTGTKIGCGIGYCGACTVHLDGRPVHACCVIVGDCEDAEISTIEQVADEPLGRAVVDAVAGHGAVQCGFCTPGFVMSGVGGLRQCPGATPRQVREYLVGNICRCTGYAKLVEAIASVDPGSVGS